MIFNRQFYLSSNSLKSEGIVISKNENTLSKNPNNFKLVLLFIGSKNKNILAQRIREEYKHGYGFGPWPMIRFP